MVIVSLVRLNFIINGEKWGITVIRVLVAIVVSIIFTVAFSFHPCPSSIYVGRLACMNYRRSSGRSLLRNGQVYRT